MSLATRTQGLFDKIKDFPEAYDNGRAYLKPHAFAAFMDLRKLFENEILMALHRIEAGDPLPKEATQEMIEAAWEVFDREGVEAPLVEVMQAVWEAMEQAR